MYELSEVTVVILPSLTGDGYALEFPSQRPPTATDLWAGAGVEAERLIAEAVKAVFCAK